MKETTCFVENISKYAVGILFLVLALGLVITGFTVFPIFGFLFAAPVFLISFYFFRTRLNKECEIE